MRTVAIINQKGGCGKTTTAINLGGILAASGFRTLLVDMDPQSHCAAGLAVPEERIDLGVADLLLAGPDRPADPARLIWRVARHFDLIPSRMRLAGLEAARGGLADQPDKDRRLATALAAFADDYDVCLVDCSPAIGLLTYNALAAAEAVLIPVETGFFSLEGATKQANTVRTLARRLGVEAPYWIVATIHDETSPLSRDLLDELRRRFGDRVAPAVVRRDPRLKEAASYGQPIIEYAPDSPGARDYTLLARWLIEAAGLSGGERPRLPRAILADPDEVYAPVGGGEAGAARAAQGARPAVAAVAQAELELKEPALAAPTRAEEVAARARQLLLRRAEGSAAGQAAKSPGPLVLAPEPRPAGAPAPVEAIQPLLGVRVTAQGVLFVQPLTAGASIGIAGDFNGWSGAANPMRRNEPLGVFEACIPLAPGRYRYRLIVDGRWGVDPYNPASELNEFGERNSVVCVSEPGR